MRQDICLPIINMRVLFLGMFYMLLNGCSSISSSEIRAQLVSKKIDISEHVMYIDKYGHLDTTFTGESIDPEQYIERLISKLEVEDFTDKQQHCNVDNGELKPKQISSITFFIHGGMNTKDSLGIRTEKTIPKMLCDGTYPIFIAWDSELLNNYWDHLALIRQGEVQPTAGKLSFPYFLFKDLLASVIEIPESFYYSGERFIEVLRQYESFQEQSANNAFLHLKANTSFRLYNSNDDTGIEAFDNLTIINPVKLITTPIISQGGKGAWQSMKRRTNVIFFCGNTYYNYNSDTGANGEVCGGPFIDLPRGSTASTLFFDKFKNSLASEKFTINLIGHSMGAIVANHLLTLYPTLKFDNIIHLASAASVKEVGDSLNPYLHKNPDSKFYALSINPYNDLNESNYLDFVPRGSLLVWLDNFFINPDDFRDLTSGFWFNMVRSVETIFPNKEIQKRVHLVQFGIDDGKPPSTHGSFDDYQFWLPDFWKGDFCEKKYVVAKDQFANVKEECAENITYE